MTAFEGTWKDRSVRLSGKLLLPERSQSFRMHSPDGFSWGYGGSGPAQLALAVMLEICPDEESAMRSYQDFKWEVIVNLPMEEDFSTDIDPKKWCSGVH